MLFETSEFWVICVNGCIFLSIPLSARIDTEAVCVFYFIFFADWEGVNVLFRSYFTFSHPALSSQMLISFCSRIQDSFFLWFHIFVSWIFQFGSNCHKRTGPVNLYRYFPQLIISNVWIVLLFLLLSTFLSHLKNMIEFL